MFKNDATFYQNPLAWERLFTIFVRGDRLVIYPVLLFSLILFFFNRQYALVFILVFLTLRFFIEIIYQLTSTFTCAFFLTCLIIYLDYVP